jgi:hypothetical protein
MADSPKQHETSDATMKRVSVPVAPVTNGAARLPERRKSRKGTGADTIADVWPWIHALKAKLSDSTKRSDPPASSDGQPMPATERSTRPEPPECISFQQLDPMSPTSSTHQASSDAPFESFTPEIIDVRSNSFDEVDPVPQQMEAGSLIFEKVPSEPDAITHENITNGLPQPSLAKELGDSQAADVIGRLIEAAKNESRPASNQLTEAAKVKSRPSIIEVDTPVRGSSHRLASPGMSVAKLPHTLMSPVSSAASMSSRSRAAGRADQKATDLLIHDVSPNANHIDQRGTESSLVESGAQALLATANDAIEGDIGVSSVHAESPMSNRRGDTSYSKHIDRIRGPSPGQSVAAIPALYSASSSYVESPRHGNSLTDAHSTISASKLPLNERNIKSDLNQVDRFRAPSPGQSAGRIPETYSSSSSVYSNSTSSSMQKSSTQYSRPRVTPETANSRRKKPTLPLHVPGNPSRGRPLTRRTSASIGVTKSKKTIESLHRRSGAFDTQSESRLHHQPPVIDVELFRKESSHKKWREGRDEIIIVDKAYDHERQSDSDTLEALLMRIEKAKSQLAETSNEKDGGESQHRLRGLIDNLARAAEQMQQIDKS